MDCEEGASRTDDRKLKMFGMLYERYEKMVLRCLYGLVNRSPFKGHALMDPEALSQETWMNVWNALQKEQFDPERPFSPWAQRVARNVYLNTRRTVIKETGLVPIEDPSVIRIIDPDADILAEVEREELNRFLNNAIQALPSKYREPLVLREFEGLSYKEIADFLTLKMNTVKSRIHRARKMVKEAIQDYEY